MNRFLFSGKIQKLRVFSDIFSIFSLTDKFEPNRLLKIRFLDAGFYCTLKCQLVVKSALGILMTNVHAVIILRKLVKEFYT